MDRVVPLSAKQTAHMGLIYIADELHVEGLVIEAEDFEDSMLSKQ